MKTVKLYDHAHKQAKIKAAESGGTTTHFASCAVIYVANLLASGRLTVAKLDEANHKVEAGK